MHFRFHTPRRRPDWWPENEPWPPRGRLRKSPFFRRIGCLFGAFNGVGLAVLVILAVVVGNSLGWGQAPAHFLGWVVPGAVGVAVFLLAAFVLGGLGLRRALLPLDDLLDASGNVLRTATGSGGSVALSLNGLAGGVYYVRIAGAKAFAYSTDYDVIWSVAGAA